jgi:hypothetical protein
MNVVAPAWTADRDGDQPSRRLGRDRRWDRRVALLDSEAAALLALRRQGLRRNRAVGVPRRNALHWGALARLTEPLEAAVAGLHHGDDVRFRRAGRQAAAIVLQHCADTGRSWWGWTPWEWARLCGGSAREFVAAQSLPTDSTVRPFVMVLAYLLGGFTDFHHLGMFNRLHLACLIFGGPTVDEAMRCAEEVLDRWGYRISKGTRSRLRGVFSQALLLNRSPRLDDLDTAAFAALRAHPATDGHQGSMLYAQQRVVAAKGYCDPPVRTGYLQPAGIEGANPVWAAWIQRWHATSTLTPRVRATIRTIMAKAGRWLAVEHPEITEPGQWSRATCATCAAWVAAVDWMSVGDWTQRRGTYSFFEQCPHRMACARCDFYTPKGSTKAQLFEAKDNLQRMRATIPLTDHGRAAVDDGHTAVTRLLDRLADVPTPAGPTPRELGTPATVTTLPIVQIRTGNSS